MRKAIVYLNGDRVGELTEVNRDLYTFQYDDLWYADDDLPSISLTLSKKQQAYQADHLFPFFANMLSEGVNRQLQSRHWQVDEADDFGLLLKTATTDTIGAVTVQAIEE